MQSVAEIAAASHDRVTKWSGTALTWVEQGKQSVCKGSPTMTKKAIKDLIRKELGLTDFDAQAVKDRLKFI